VDLVRTVSCHARVPQTFSSFVLYWDHACLLIIAVLPSWAYLTFLRTQEPHSSSCERFAQQDDLSVRTEMAELDRTAWTYSYCEPHSLQHFFTDVSEYEQSNNLAIVVEDIEVNTDPESLTVMHFQGEAGDEPPVDPTIDDADASMTRALGKNYALNLNYLQLSEGRVIVTVRCGASAVRFRVVASLVHAKLVEGEHQIGMMYPGKQCGT
jgi:hypothetical protein